HHVVEGAREGVGDRHLGRGREEALLAVLCHDGRHGSLRPGVEDRLTPRLYTAREGAGAGCIMAPAAGRANLRLGRKREAWPTTAPASGATSRTSAGRPTSTAPRRGPSPR